MASRSERRIQSWTAARNRRDQRVKAWTLSDRLNMGWGLHDLIMDAEETWETKQEAEDPQHRW